MTQDAASDTERNQPALVDLHDIEEPDDLDKQIFAHINHLRRQGYSFREIVPRLRDLADYCEQHADRFDDWDR